MRRANATLRDLFAVHAPPVPRWFLPARDGRPDVPLAEHWLSEYGMPSSCIDDFGYVDTNRIPEELKDAASEFNAERHKAVKRLYDWKHDGIREATVQWPYWWADQQLTQRAKD